MAEHQPFPRPFIITVGVPKGGDCKSWLALNFASRLGMWGHDVLVVDCNQQHDLVVDYMTLTNRGVYPRFDVLMHTPLSPEGLPTAPLDLKLAHHRDFIVFDTAQFVEFPTTRWAWANCHLMLVPVTPHTSQRHNYQTAIRLFHALPGRRPPIAAVPCKIDVLKNSTPQKMLDQTLLFLKDQGCLVPPFGSGFQVPNNPTMAAQETRWICGETSFNGHTKRLPEDFLLRVDLTFRWLLDVIENHYGRLPSPKLPPLPVLKPQEVLKALSREQSQRAAASAGASSATI